MQNGNIFPKFVRIAAIESPYSKSPHYRLQLDNNSTLSIPDAPLITILSEVLKFKFDIIQPEDNTYGENKDGNWTGLLGLMQRKQADLIINKLSLTEERASLVDVSIPYQYVHMTFITDKPKYVPDMMAMLHPFSLSLWLAVVVSFLLVQPLLYLFRIKNYSFQNMLFKIFGSLLEKAVNIKLRKVSTKILILSWVLGAMLITQSYKAVLLSFLTFPSLRGIRDIAELAEAAEKSSFMCSTYAGTTFYTDTFVYSADESWQRIGRCLQRSNKNTFEVESFLKPSTYQKAFMGVKFHLKTLGKKYFISDDVFYYDLHVLGIQKSFCCKDLLDYALLRVAAAGIFDKFDREDEFFMALDKNDPPDEDPNRKLSLEDFFTAFIILILGYFLSFTAFAFEILLARKQNYNF